MKDNQELLTVIVDKNLKAAFMAAVGKKYMSHSLRNAMKRIIKKNAKQ